MIQLRYKRGLAPGSWSPCGFRDAEQVGERKNSARLREMSASVPRLFSGTFSQAVGIFCFKSAHNNFWIKLSVAFFN